MTANEFTVYAAQSLEPAFRRLLPLFEAASGVSVKTVYGHTGALRLEIEGHMPCDVFCGADRANAEALERSGAAQGLFPFARNRLIVVTRDERRFWNEDWSTILCDPSIAIGTSTPITSPEGDWTGKLFQNIAKAFPKMLGSKIIAQHSVALIGGTRTDEDLEKETGAAFILRHGVDAAVVYGSWAAWIEAEGLKIHEIAPEVQPEILYHACFPRKGEAPSPLKKAFKEFLLSDPAQTILKEAGFLAP